VTACFGDTSVSADGDTGGTLVISAPGTQNTLLPPLTTDQTARAVTDNLYETLAEIGPELGTLGDRGFKPQLARSWEWSTDSISIAFALDPAAKWHDGRPVRASDVRFSIDLVKDPKTASPVAALLANVDSISVRDSLTAVAWFRRRTPEQFYDLAFQLRVMPEHVLKDVPREQLATSEVTRRPVGSGRFRFVRWEPGVRIEVIADTAHYRGRPKLDRVIWSFASDGNAAVTQLFSGQVDYFESLSPDLLPRVDSSGQVKAVRYPALQYSIMGFNQRDPRRRSTPHPVFGDVRVRRALSMALDRESMLRNVFDTLGTLGSGPYTRSLADTTVPVPPFDAARAAALLDSAGWVPGADGIRSKNGRPLAFSILVPNSSRPRMRYAVLIQEQLKSVGARVTIDALAFPEFVPKMQARSFDAIMHTIGTDPSPATIKQDWGSGAINGGANYMSYSSARFDALLDSAASTFDVARSRAYYHRAYQTLVDDAPAVWLYDPLYLAGVHRRVRPENLRPYAWWSGLGDFWIPGNERIERDRIGLRPGQP
jgi:peptide/nickel transport system substrate-binding protein